MEQIRTSQTENGMRVSKLISSSNSPHFSQIEVWLFIYYVHAGESLRFLVLDWLRNGSWARGSVPGGSATVSLPLAI